MFNIELIDLIVILAYFAGITGLGVWTKKMIQSSDDYFMGNRRFGKILMIAQGFGVGSHTDQPVSVAGASYTAGLAGIWYQWLWLFTTPFYWMISPIYRRLRYITMADFFDERYGKSLGMLYTIMGIIFLCMNIGLMLKGTGVTIEGVTRGEVNSDIIILIATGLFLIYGVAGGLIAATVTDAVQGVFIVILSVMLIPFALTAAGGVESIHQGLPEKTFNLFATEEVTLFFVIMVTINGLFGIVVQPHHMSVGGGSAKSEIASRVGWTYGNFTKRIITMAWAFTGVIGAFLYPDMAFEKREFIFGIMAGELLPAGFVGLMIASLLSAVMSTCDAFMVHGSALYTRNIYLSYLNPGATQQQMLYVGRITSVIIVVGGLFFAYAFPTVIQGLIEMWKFTAFLGVGFWFGVVWKKANRYGVWASTISMLIISVVTGNLLGWELPYQILAYLPTGILIMWVVSYFSRPEPEEKLHDFYTLLNTPVGEEKRLHEANVAIKLEGMSEKKKKREKSSTTLEKMIKEEDEDDGLILVDLLSLKKRFSWNKYRTDLLGFLVALGIVIVLIILYGMLANIGT